MCDERIDEHVGGASVEGEDLLRLGRGRKDSDVSDASEIEGDAAEFRVAIEKIVRIGNERRALATEGDVSGTKIADRGDAGVRGDDGRLADLQRGGGGAPQKGDALALVENRLAVAANERDFLRCNPEFATRRHGGAGEEFSHAKVQLADGARSDGVLFGDAQNFLAKRGRKFDRGMAQQLDVQIGRRAGNASQCNVDTVGRGAGHHAENKHGLLAHEICFLSSARRLSASRGFNWSRSAPRSLSSTSRSSAVKSTC